jgi:hypothetical protein
MKRVIKLSSSDATRPVTKIQIHQCYLRLARRLVKSVEGLKDVAIFYHEQGIYCKQDIYYRATQSESGKIKVGQAIKPMQTFYQFPCGLLDTWA